MAYHIYLDLFEGPLDLLLFLVSKAQIDIKDIFVSKVTSQYIEFVSALEDTDMDRASEFIHMATRLLEIKSKKLLPKKRIEDENEEDPEQLLIRQLEDFKILKQASGKLETGHNIAKNRFYRLASQLEDKIDLDLSGITISTLKNALQNILIEVEELKEDEPIQEIFREEITVEQRMSYIKKRLKSHKKMTFTELFDGSSSKYEVIITFMALLEMLKLNTIKVTQTTPRDDLIIAH